MWHGAALLFQCVIGFKKHSTPAALQSETLIWSMSQELNSLNQNDAKCRRTSHYAIGANKIFT